MQELFRASAAGADTADHMFEFVYATRFAGADPCGRLPRCRSAGGGSERGAGGE